jgi:hypothetical protein
VKNSEVFLENFQKNVERKDWNKNGGGVFIAVSGEHETCTVENSNSYCEITWNELVRTLS